MEVPILGRTQAKLMNYISYPEIHAPQDRDSLKTTPTTDQTAQEELQPE